MLDLRRTVVLVVDVRTSLAGSREPLQFNGHDMSLNLPIHGFRAKLMRDCGGRDVGGLDQTRRVASLDLAAKRCALAVSNGGNARRDSPAARGQRGHLGQPRESALCKILHNDGRSW